MPTTSTSSAPTDSTPTDSHRPGPGNGTGRALKARPASILTTASQTQRDDVRGKNNLSPEGIADVVLDETAYIDDNNKIFFVDTGVESSGAAPSTINPATVNPSTINTATINTATINTATINTATTNSTDNSTNPTVDPDADTLPTGSDTISEAGSYTAQQAFSLHSRPGSTKTLYIDFDGTTVTNTYWNQTTGIPSKTVPPYDVDGNPSSFSQTELNLIGDIWSAVSEDYAPFDVDVTTATPTGAQIVRTSSFDNVYGTSIVVTTDNWICPATCAGVAYLNSFWNTTNTLLGVDQAKPGWTFTSPYFASVPAIVAGIVSHEAGHTFGLSHDGTTSVSYYGGQGIWQPIMGSGSYYSRPVSQWSFGEYANANNQENDISKIAVTSPIVGDDVATFEVAPAGQISTTFSRSIETSTDTDTFQIAVGSGGRLIMSFTPNAISPNLDAIVRVRNSANALVGESNPGGIPSSQSLDLTVPAGIYSVTVSSTGYLSPFDTGYSNYGSLGRYDLKLMLAAVPNAPVNALASLGDSSVAVSWQGPADNGGAPVIDYGVTICSRLPTASSSTCDAPVYTTASNMTFNNLTVGKLVSFFIVARNVVGSSFPARSAEVTVVRAPGAPSLNPLALTATGFNFSWVPVILPDVTATGFETSVVDLTTGASTRRTFTTATTSDSFDPTITGHTYEVKVRSLSSVLAGNWSGPRVITIGRSPVSAASGNAPTGAQPAPGAPGVPGGSRLPVG